MRAGQARVAQRFHGVDIPLHGGLLLIFWRVHIGAHGHHANGNNGPLAAQVGWLAANHGGGFLISQRGQAKPTRVRANKLHGHDQVATRLNFNFFHVAFVQHADFFQIKRGLHALTAGLLQRHANARHGSKVLGAPRHFHGALRKSFSFKPLATSKRGLCFFHLLLQALVVFC